MTVRRIFTATALVIVLVADASPTSPQQRFADPRPSSEELWSVATRLASASGAIASVWPGFWSTEDGFLLISPQGGMLLMAPWRAPDPFVAAKKTAESFRAYEAEGALPGYEDGRFPGTFELDGHRVYALPPMGRSLFNRTAFYVHEAFHFFQRGDGAWAETPEDSISGLSPTKFVSDTTVVMSPAFRLGLAKEDSLLLRIASATDPALVRKLLGDYYGARTARLRQHPDIAAIERRYERREGTAEYIGCRAAVLATGGDTDEFIVCITDELDKESTELAQLLRWRLYASGAVISAALDRLGIEGWKDAVASGTRLDEIVAREVGLF